MLDYDSLEEFRDPQTYDLECDDVVEELPLIEQWARSHGGPLLDLACGTGRTALRLAARGYQVTGVDVVPEMLARARQKAAGQTVSVAWVEADVPTPPVAGVVWRRYTIPAPAKSPKRRPTCVEESGIVFALHRVRSRKHSCMRLTYLRLRT